MSITDQCEACSAYQNEGVAATCEDHRSIISTLDFKRILSAWKKRILAEDGMTHDEYQDQQDTNYANI